MSSSLLACLGVESCRIASSCEEVFSELCRGSKGKDNESREGSEDKTGKKGSAKHYSTSYLKLGPYTSSGR